MQQNIGNFLDYKSMVFSSQSLKKFHLEFIKTATSKDYSVFNTLSSTFKIKEKQSVIPILFSSNINFKTISADSKQNEYDLPYSYKKDILLECQIFDYNNSLQIIFDFNTSVYSKEKIMVLKKKYTNNIIQFIAENK